METKTSWHSCRLVVNRDSGRIKWCIGQERTWKTRLKILVFIPAILLPITIICIIVSQLNLAKPVNSQDLGNISNLMHPDYDNTEIINEDDRDVVKSLKTSFLSTSFNTINNDKEDEQRNLLGREKRQIEEQDNVFAEYEDNSAMNISAEVEDLYNPSQGILWKILDKRTDSGDIELEKSENGRINGHPEVLPNTVDLDLHRAFWKDKLGPLGVRKLQGKIMRRYLDEKVDPCQDFYKFACGNWERYNPIPSDRAGYDTFEMLRENLYAVLKELLTEEDEVDPKQLRKIDHRSEMLENRAPLRVRFGEQLLKQREFYVPNINDTLPQIFYENINVTEIPKSALSKAKFLYNSCMNTELINKRGAKPLQNLLTKMGGWPMLHADWDESAFDWLLLIGQLRLYNNDVLISEWIGPDIKNSDEYMIQIDQAGLGLPTREYFLDASNLKYIEAYRVYIVQVATLLGAEYERAASGAEEIINFETNLAAIMASADDRRNISELYKRMKLSDLRMIIPQIDWARYLSMIMTRRVAYEEEIVCFSIEYLQKLVQLLSETSPRVVANYVHWRFIRHRVNNLDQKFQDVKQRFYYILYGREKAPPRWQMCVAQVNSNMGMAVGSLFVDRYFDEVSKNDTLYMTIEIQKAFRQLLVKTNWLDEETRELARMKMDAMKLRIGYPDFILDERLLKDRYKDVIIHPETYFENNLSILQHLTRVEQARLGIPVNKTLWNTAPAVINAYYSRNKNLMMFPAGILQPPFYHRWFPRSLNYGGIGVVIGHEITHGFDDKGRLFDRDGNLYKWWNDEAIKGFHRRAACLINQYNSYVVPEINMHIDGQNTQGENIADNGGIKQSFRAYMNWLRNNPDVDETIPGLNMTSTQLFFLNFAQVWCGSMRPEAARSKLKTAVHPPGRFRVIGTLSNFVDFAQEFNCAPGTPMNPITKCSIW